MKACCEFLSLILQVHMDVWPWSQDKKFGLLISSTVFCPVYSVGSEMPGALEETAAIAVVDTV